MPSKQSEYFQQQSLQRLQAMVPHDCPLTVVRRVGGGFSVRTLDLDFVFEGRFQIVAAWIDGYLSAWLRSRRNSELGG